MICFYAFGVRFSLPLLTLLFPFLAARLTANSSASAVFFALGVHELAHLLAAKLFGVGIAEIRLMPFGGSARMENPYQVASGRLIPVAAAGPLANLMLAVLFAAFAHWGLLSPVFAAKHIQSNLVLFVFNLLPALPLDGGRILFALLRIPMGEHRAQNICLWTGCLLAALLLASGAYIVLRTGKWNLTLILSAVFILASVRDERSALAKSHAQRLAHLQQAMTFPLPLRIYQIDENTAVRDALQLLRARERTWFLLSRESAPCKLLSDYMLLGHLLQNGAPDEVLSNLHAYSLPEERTSGAQNRV